MRLVYCAVFIRATLNEDIGTFLLGGLASADMRCAAPRTSLLLPWRGPAAAWLASLPVLRSNVFRDPVAGAASGLERLAPGPGKLKPER